MKVSEAVQEMTKFYLHRVIDSFTKDFPKPDEEHAREIILKNVDELTDPGRIASALKFKGTFADQVLMTFILEALVNRPDCVAGESEIIAEVGELENGILETAADPECFRYENERSIDIMKAVLEVALEDEQLNMKELSLVRRLREKLGLSRASRYTILAHLGYFPKAGNILHTPSEFSDALIDLQRRGVIFYCNKLEDKHFVIPDEMVGPVKKALDIELSRETFRMMLDVLTRVQLSNVLEARGLPKSGRKTELQERVVRAGIQPSHALDILSNQELYDICSSLPGAKVSGTKSERIDRIIDYFANLVVRDVPTEASPGERYYEYLIELAARDRENLLANKIIRKDRDMDDAFEEGTRFLFREKLGLHLEDMVGNDHCDGCMRFGKNKKLFMWDNKSKESIYSFPPSHMRQFKRYIRDAHDRVSCFLIIVPEIAEEAEQNAARLKVESGMDTDIALITAEDLVWVAEEWATQPRDVDFDLNVFNITGILSRSKLEQRMTLFLQ